MASLDRELTAGPLPPRARRWREYTQLSRQIKQAGLLDRRALRPVISYVLPLDAAAEAHRILEAGHAGGKIVLNVKGGL